MTSGTIFYSTHCHHRRLEDAESAPSFKQHLSIIANRRGDQNLLVVFLHVLPPLLVFIESHPHPERTR